MPRLETRLRNVSPYIASRPLSRYFGALSHGKASLYTLIESAKLNGVNPNAYLNHVLTELPSAKAKDLDALLPWNFQPQPEPEVVI